MYPLQFMLFISKELIEAVVVSCFLPKVHVIYIFYLVIVFVKFYLQWFAAVTILRRPKCSSCPDTVEASPLSKSVIWIGNYNQEIRTRFVRRSESGLLLRTLAKTKPGRVSFF